MKALGKCQSRLERRGFSLLELLLAASIAMMVAGFRYSLSHGRESAMSSGLAQEVAEELRAARQQAISKQKPVALGFPGGASCQSFYQLEGLSVPQVVRQIDYSETYPKACMFWGLWSGGTAEDVVAAGVGSQYRLADWQPFPSTNPVLYFSPTGAVQSNGQAVYTGGEYDLDQQRRERLPGGRSDGREQTVDGLDRAKPGRSP